MTEDRSPPREISATDWGRIVIEELLFRAAREMNANDPVRESVTVSLTFELRPDRDAQAIEIRMPGAVEREIVTRLPLAAL